MPRPTRSSKKEAQKLADRFVANVEQAVELLPDKHLVELLRVIGREIFVREREVL